MDESATYREIIEKGVVKRRTLEARSILLRQGRKLLGEPDSSAATLISLLDDRSRLEFLIERILNGSVKSWAELLAMV